jgi:predicted dehydrogenase
MSTLGVAMVGHAFMGRVHSHAWRNVAAFFDLPVTPSLAVLCGRDAERTQANAARYGFQDSETDWRRILERDDVHIVDICSPGDTHAEIAVEALEAGKHVLCEKPLANSVAQAAAMAEAAERCRTAGVCSMVGFNYRRVPAIGLARRLVAEGRLGRLRHVRAQYLQDWLVDTEHPLVWRLRKERAGSGALGDIAAHIVDTVQYVTGERISEVSGLLETFVRERPLADGVGTGEVTVDDAALFLGRLTGGSVASFEATRFATGRRNSLRLEINGSLGSVAFDLESLNELYLYDNTEDADRAGFRRILVTEPAHPYVGAWWPAGHILGYEHTFTHEVKDFLEGIGAGTDPQPSFTDGLQVQRVLAAVETSAATGSWEPVASS